MKEVNCRNRFVEMEKIADKLSSDLRACVYGGEWPSAIVSDLLTSFTLHFIRENLNMTDDVIYSIYESVAPNTIEDNFMSAIMDTVSGEEYETRPSTYEALPFTEE